MIRLIPQPLEITENGGFCGNETNTVFTRSAGKDDGSYTLKITASGAEITSGGEKGDFYARMTLREMKILYGKYPVCEIRDSPAFAYRGFMIDCARHFFDVAELKKMIDLAAMLKFNYFHWHLSDDQGFRIELDTYPELTKKGSVRYGDNFGAYCSGDEKYGGCYTKEQIRDIVEYCEKRFITVIPEIDMPGHTSAILHVFPQLGCRKEPVDVKRRQGIYKDNLCVGNPETEIFVKNLLTELCGIFPGEYFHIGGDEAPDVYRENCPFCEKEKRERGLESYRALRMSFSEEIADFLEKNGKKAIIWNDVLTGGSVKRGITVQKWMDMKNNSAVAANGGAKLIISDFTPYYLDYPYAMHTLRAIYKKNPLDMKGLTPFGRSNIIGIETPVWTEYIATDERLEYMCLPRWFAFAENAWGRKENKDFVSFSRACDTLCDRLTEAGYTVAPKKDRYISPLKRLPLTEIFFIKTLKNKEK